MNFNYNVLVSLIKFSIKRFINYITNVYNATKIIPLQSNRRIYSKEWWEKEWGNGNHDLVKKLKISESLHWIKIMSNIGIWSIWNALNWLGFLGLNPKSVGLRARCHVCECACIVFGPSINSNSTFYLYWFGIRTILLELTLPGAIQNWPTVKTWPYNVGPWLPRCSTA